MDNTDFGFRMLALIRSFLFSIGFIIREHMEMERLVFLKLYSFLVGVGDPLDG